MTWKPNEDIIKESNIHKMMAKHHSSDYHKFWQWTVSNKKEFWTETIDNLEIQFSKPFTSVFDSNDVENPHWLKDAKLNIVDSCFQNDDETTAVIYQAENGEIQKISQQSLKNAPAYRPFARSYTACKWGMHTCRHGVNSV